MEVERKRPVSISRSVFQANSLKVLRRSEEHSTPVLVTKNGFPTHIILPLDRARITQYEQIPVDKYIDDALAQWGPEVTETKTLHSNKEKQHGNSSTTNTNTTT